MNALPLRIVVFAKAPRPGQAKTRLIPALGADGAARRVRGRIGDDSSGESHLAKEGVGDM